MLHTCNVASSKGNSKLLIFVALCLRLGDKIGIQCTHNVLKRGELHHRVGNLATP
jgi:hypothetical protein